MSKPTSFHIYNASAGSGKTFTLVKEYLKLLFLSKRPDLFRNILALTFTNKAVGEMKSRILNTLQEFSDEAILEKHNSMFSAISEELQLSAEELHHNSQKILHTILHNYAAFDISTIDRFTHKVIRTFAFDLNIPVNFEVELDTDTLLSEAVDRLIAKAGKSKALTKVLIDFAIEKADDDKSWDIAFDFNKVAKLLVNENDIPYLETLKDKTLEDFAVLKTTLHKHLEATQKNIENKANEALTLIEESGIEHNDFSGRNGYVPSYFVKLTKHITNIAYDKVWMQHIESHPLYPKATEPSIASILDAIQSQIASFFHASETLVNQHKFLKNVYKNITPLSVLNAINSELKAIKDEKNVLLISEFNKTIYNEIKDQPTPFIYERIGERFKHYFIDEFQDTSELQWENLIPLIDNALSSHSGTAMLVGDAKQSIYRWRGGKPELFIDLFNENNPFQVEKSIHDLPTNYRSCKTIVDFNNAFFDHLATFAFQDDKHKALFKASKQEQFLKQEGYVHLEFLEFGYDDNRDDFYTEAVKHSIDKALSHGFNLRDICVLVRKKKEGVAVAEYLSSQNIDIISSETLLLSRSPKVNFIANILKLSTQPEHKELKAEVLYFIADLISIKDKHAFIDKHLLLDTDALSQALTDYEIDFSFNFMSANTLYNAVEYCVRQFGLVSSSDAYVQFYLDIVLEFSEKQSSNILEFIAYWEKKQEQLSITIPDSKNAVQIMTIHKSKGLEFPVVIFPYADLNLYKEMDPKVWFSLENNEFNDFSHTLLNYNKDIANFGTQGETLYNEKQAQLELDNINLLYVTLTRPVEQLYIISKKDIDTKGLEKLNTYSGLFINYLKHKGIWNESRNTYSFGSDKKTISYKGADDHSVFQESFISNANTNTIKIVTNSGYLWDTKQEKAIEKGNLMHYLMSKIDTAKDVDFILNDALVEGLINQDQLDQLKDAIFKLVNHNQLKSYFSQGLKIYNERDIIASNGIIIRPDRFVLDAQNNATIIDYKTGTFYPEHFQQLQSYQDVIETMGFPVIKKILIYINDDIEIKEL